MCVCVLESVFTWHIPNYKPHQQCPVMILSQMFLLYGQEIVPVTSWCVHVVSMCVHVGVHLLQYMCVRVDVHLLQYMCACRCTSVTVHVCV